ncbi:MAG TPA: hypothetical protein VIJ62_08010 [Rhizomicrobium sp.]
MALGVIIARQRSGTGALGSVLDQHPSVSSLGEVFHHDAIDREPNYFWFLRNLIEKDPDMGLPGAYGKRFALYADFLKARTKKAHTIIDIKYSSLHHFNAHWLGILEPPTIFQVLRGRKVPVIHLGRKNHLKAFVSGQLAQLNDEWHAKSQDAITIRNLKIDPRACLQFIRTMKREYERVKKILEKHPRLLELEYSEIFDEVGELCAIVAQQLADFLQIAPFKKHKPAFVKQTPEALRNVIENFDELAKALDTTEHAWMLRDD